MASTSTTTCEHLSSASEADNGPLLTSLLPSRPLPQLTRIQTVDVPGIFDMKWSRPFISHEHGININVRQGGLLGAALADGTLRGYRLARGDDDGSACAESITLSEACNCSAFPDGGGMALSLDWRQLNLHGPVTEATECGASARSDVKVAVSSSSGYCSVLQVRASFGSDCGNGISSA